MIKILTAIVCLSGAIGYSKVATDSTYIQTSDKVTLFVKTTGQGTPLLFIHGGPGSTCLYFEKGTQGKLNDLGKWIFVDQRGSGRSHSDPQGNYQLSRVVQDFEEIRQKLNLPRWIIVAHSFGGILATQYATEYPESVEKIVYLNATISLPDSVNYIVSYLTQVIPNLKPDDKNLMEDKSRKLTERFGKAFGILQRNNLLHSAQFEAQENFEKDQKDMQSIPLNWDFASKVFGYEEYLKSFAPQTQKIKCPILIISGQKDHVVGPNHHLIFKAPNQSVYLSEGSHGLYRERTHELYAILQHFLTQP